MADNNVNSGLLEFSEDQKVFVALDAETSEVKKAVTIDGDGVETDIQGVQPTGKKEITSTAEVNVASYATAQVVDEDLIAGNIKKDVDILGVVGSYEPEAPASDFSTAECTIVAPSPIAIIAPCITPNGIDGNIYSGDITDKLTVVLYQDNSKVWSADADVVSVSGNAEIDDGIALITGDCTITFAQLQ